MRRERIRELDESIHRTTFQPKEFINETAAGGPLVSIYIPVKQVQREGGQQDWDRVEFKDLSEEALRRLAKDYAMADFAGIQKKLNYILEHEDLPLWVDASQGLAFLVTNQDAYVINMSTAPESAVVVGPQFYLKPLFRDQMHEVNYRLLLLNADFFALLEGDRNSVHYVPLPDDVKSFFAETFPEFDGETTALDYYSLTDHESPYHDHKSRKDVKQEEAEKFFRYVNKAMTDTLDRTSTDPVILVTAPEHESFFRKICTFDALLPEGIRKDPRSLSGSTLRDDAVAIMDALGAKDVAKLEEDYGYRASKGEATDRIPDIGLALVERKVSVLFLEEGKGIPGTFDATTGEVSFDGSPNPVDDKALDPASPDVAAAFAEAAALQDAQILVLPADKMPVTSSIAATFRF